MSSEAAKSLLARLHTFSDDVGFDEVVSAITLDKATAAAEHRCALVRWFDKGLFDFVCDGLESKPDYNSFCQSPNVTGRPGRWTLESSVRQRHLTDWQQKDHNEWRTWNARLFEYFLHQYETRQALAERSRVLAEGSELQPVPSDLQLDTLYHVAASPDPSRGVVPFRQWYTEAEDRFDLGQMNALLEILRLQESWRGSALSQEWQMFRRYYAARMLFLDDYYATGAYFYRDDPYTEFKKVLDPEHPSPADPWIFHIHATGGMGKTMFLRWVISRQLLPRRIPCARVDFDDYDLTDMIAHPLRILTRIVEQWAVQVPGNLLTPLLLYLRKSEDDPTWNQSIIDEVRRQLKGAGTVLNTPMLVVLDTLEEATLSAQKWLEQCLDAIHQMRVAVPNLKLVLSGRYDLETKAPGTLRQREFIPYDLPHFSDDESVAYLKTRGVLENEVLQAIVQRAAVDESTGETAAADRRLEGRNPFKLALFAEIVLNRPEIKAGDILTLPRADIAYLMERVIIRIKSLPLRWLIYYGAIARHLTVEFVDEVLLPPLRRALRGEADDPNLPDYPGVWNPHPDLADAITAEGLWNELRRYVRERGWVSLATVDGRAELRFHPEVVRPTRELLRSQPVVPSLHEKAIDYFESRSQSPKDAETLTPQQVRALVPNMCEAVFHRFQLDGTAAEQYWHGQITQAERFGPSYALPVASEIFGRDYAEGQRKPIPDVSSEPLLAAAHCEAAALLLADAGIHFSNTHANWSNFNQRVEMAELIEGDAKASFVPALLRALNSAYRINDLGPRTELLKSAFNSSSSPGEQFFFDLHLGLTLAVLRLPDAPVHLRRSLASLPAPKRSGVHPSDIRLALANFYSFEGQHSAVLECLRGGEGDAANDLPRLATILEREARYALETRDYRTAARILDGLRGIPLEQLPSRNTTLLLECRLAFLRGDLSGALDKSIAAIDTQPTTADRARLEDICGQAHASRLEFRDALNRWSTATSFYESARIPTGSAWCALLSNRLRARWMGDVNKAAMLMNDAVGLPGMRDATIYIEAQLLRAFIAIRQEKGEDAAAILSELLQPRSPEWPPVLRARIRLFGAITSLTDASPDYFEELIETIADVEPIGLRLTLLDWTEHCDDGAKVPEPFVQALLRLMPAYKPEGSEPLISIEPTIGRADLCRIFGRLDDARDTVARVENTWTPRNEEGDVLALWHLNRLRERLHLQTEYVSLLGRIRNTELADTALEGVIAIEAAFEALATRNDRQQALQLAETAGHRIQNEDPNMWQARLLELRASLASASDAETLRSQAASLYSMLGDAARRPESEPDQAVKSPDREQHQPQSDQVQEITVSDSPLFLQATPRDSRIDVTIDWLLRPNWMDVPRNLSTTLAALPHATTAVKLQLSEDIDFLPWELAPQLLECKSLWRGYYQLRARPFYYAPDPGRAIHIVRSRRWEQEGSFASNSGFELEDVYYSKVPKAGTDEVPVTVQFNPVPDDFEVELSKCRPALIHFAGTLRESSGGVYLDFESSDSRSLDYASEYPDEIQKPATLIYNADRLDRILTLLPSPPFIILDILRTQNPTESLRMLMLRNQFAGQLFRLGHVRGILGAGLALPWDLWPITQILVTAVSEHRSATEALAALREPALRPRLESLTLDQVVPRFAAALWLSDPNSPVYR
jgi:hypothetical protein